MPENDRNTEPTKENRSARAVRVLLLVIFAAVLAAYAFLKFYSPDPDANVNAPDAGGTQNGGAFAGLEQRRGRYNFLVVGLDRVSRSTDIMMIVSYDVGAGRISVVQIPRDTYVKTDEVTTVVRINSYYAAYFNKAVASGDGDPSKTAVSRLAAMIEKNFGVRVNYTAVLDLDGFVNIIDAVGGVWLDIPEDMFYEDPYQDLYIDIKAGYQHLDGEHAMQFVRYRKGYVQQDIGRQDALKNFAAALLAQVKDNFNIGTVADISGVVLSNIRTNIGAADFIYFAKSALSVELSDVTMATLPGEPAMVGNASVYVLYRDDTISLLNEYLNVFDTALGGEGFDRDRVMYVHGDEASERIYYSPAGSMTDRGHSAGELYDDPLEIPRN